MEPLVETVDLDMEESNELAFKIKVEGAAPAPAKVRLVCEGGEMAYMFNGHGTGEDGVVQFVLPQMKDKLAEGLYQARVEVLIENRYFAPVHFQINFKKAIKVVAESINVVSRHAKPEIKVSAAPIVVNKPKTSPQPIVVEEASKSKSAVKAPPVAPVIAPPPRRPPPDPKPKTPDVNENMPVARDAASMTLRERYEQKQRDEQPVVVAKKHPVKQQDEESLIRELARSFIRDKRR
jgi:hypothetical protein